MTKYNSWEKEEYLENTIELVVDITNKILTGCDT